MILMRDREILYARAAVLAYLEQPRHPGDAAAGRCLMTRVVANHVDRDVVDDVGLIEAQDAVATYLKAEGRQHG